MMKLLKRMILDERGIATADWIIIITFSIAAASAVLAILMPTIQHAQTSTVNKITNITESGF